MTDETQSDFNRLRSSLTGLPDTKMTRPTTILDVNELVHERNATYVVQTHKARDAGYTVFLEVVSTTGIVRVAIPPRAAAAIYRQRETLNDRSTPASRARDKARRERARAKAQKEARKKRTIVPA